MVQFFKVTLLLLLLHDLHSARPIQHTHQATVASVFS